MIEHFVKAETAALYHGPSLVIDSENSIRRSRTETARYEFKQGLLRLDEAKSQDLSMMSVIMETIFGIAKVGPEVDGFVYSGIADKTADVDRVKALYGIHPVTFDQVALVGVEREAVQLGIPLDQYMRKIEDAIRQSGLSNPLKTQVLSGIDVVAYKGLSIVRIRVPRQTQISFVDDDCFLRMGSSTHKVKAPQIVAIAAAFTRG